MPAQWAPAKQAPEQFQSEIVLEQIHFEMLHISKFALPATFEKNVVFPRSWRERLGLLAAEHFNILKVEIALTGVQGALLPAEGV